MKNIDSNLNAPISIFMRGTAFGGGSGNPHLPHNHEFDQVVYTGTHDNDTVSSLTLFLISFGRLLITLVNMES